MKALKVALVQQSCSADRDDNITKSYAAIKRAAAQGAQLIALQELHCSVYFCQTEDPELCNLAEPIPGPATEQFALLAKELGIVLVISLFEKRAPGLYHNTAVVLDSDGSIAGIYRKMHIPDDPGYYEKFYFTPGDLGFQPVKTSLGTLGVLVCWDQWYPESARMMALAGAEILIYPTAIGFDPADTDEEQQRQKDAWITIQRSHAIANGLPVLAINRVGFEPDPSEQTAGAKFWGNSFIAGPQGEILCQAKEDEETELIWTLDLDQTETTRRIWPFLRDRRIDEYGELIKRFRD